MRTKFRLALLLSSLSLAIPFPASAQLCSNDVDWQPSAVSKPYRNDFGFSFDIPENYRTVAMMDESIGIFNPSMYEFLRCVARSGIGTSYQAAMQVNVISAPFYAAFRDTPGLESIQIGDIRASARSYRSPQYDEEYIDVLIITPDNQRLIILSGPLDSREMQQAIQTFRFN